MIFKTAGESHGKGILTLIEGLPSGLIVDLSFVNFELSRRQKGYGRGGRMLIEKDEAEILSGVICGKTTGAPVVLYIKNKDWENWKEYMDPLKGKPGREVLLPRPGHADLSGCIKYGLYNARPVLERASARETAARVAAGALFKLYLKEFGIEIASCVLKIGRIEVTRDFTFEELKESDNSPVRCPELKTEERMIEEIDKAKNNKDTLGGIFEVRARGVPPGLGSYTSWEERLDAFISYCMMSIPGIKAVGIGCSWECFNFWGSEFHDEIYWEKEKGFYRKTNRAGGIEGGISNGEEIIVKCFMKPIPTLMKPLKTVNILTKKPADAQKERSDVCAVPAASIVGEAMLAYAIAKFLKAKIGGDSIEEAKENYRAYRERIKRF